MSKVEKWDNLVGRKLPLAAIEWLEERAAILEYDAGYNREVAERMAAQMYRELEK